ncbi:MAG TPA: hypothetical protein VL244_08460 [Alphaproteobacteria bacterium]|nr:hypothetical protein [Alphaproteobacteria bacterium]
MGPGIVKGLFVGVGAFAIGLLYFYALSLSVIVVLKNDMPWYVVVGAWIFLFGVLYYEKGLDRKLKSGVL